MIIQLCIKQLYHLLKDMRQSRRSRIAQEAGSACSEATAPRTVHLPCAHSRSLHRWCLEYD